MEPSIDNGFCADHAALLARSFEAQLGRPLHSDVSGKGLYHAPFVILSHDVSEDPVLTYGNLMAQTLWEMGWDRLTTLPSRLTAEAQHRDQRDAMFQRMREYGCVEDYSGIRISATCKRFEIRNAVIWTLHDEAGEKVGEAAMFADYSFL
ncbi:MEKHLA domain protein [Tritonibacter multivorans]|uniref:MEKHLA domain protein n=1 Tax=Tritonibacter multivorans TaxID=928856 RepID=A0A0N7M0N6_9RHOB|nr:MEKHLA domain-containing protein [Tritonibacter multivorans]MDA7420802.1 MEKHLA domain-containing protein [Tritonibacter multivorans]CUH80969.1 MEKHLA domain protein [Tritonibacter multivorans]SFC86243.1 MEKHLA domain-containing protein [Tritonibacter multivorans]